MGLCHGPIDQIIKIIVDKKDAWTGTNDGSEQIHVNAENLFGGAGREGGVSGYIDVEMGYPDQIQNDYLVSKIGSDIPSFRGICAAVLRQVYMGLNPYLKSWGFRAQRVHVRQNGIDQWYDEKAEISNLESGLIIANSQNELNGLLSEIQIGNESYWDYQIVNGGWNAPPSNIWLYAQAPFGNASSVLVNTSVGSSCGRSIWIKRTITIPEKIITSKNLTLNVNLVTDDGWELFWNGIKQTYATYEVNSGLRFLTYTIGAEDILKVNEFKARCIDCYLDDGTSSGSNAAIYIRAALTFEAELSDEAGSYFPSMNPAHIIRECLTDPDWGMGYNDSDIDSASFINAADTLYDERMGISLLWDRQSTIEDFVKEILRHIDAALYLNHKTGKFVLKLIRNDYNTDNLITLDENHISKVDNYSRIGFGELVNSVIVNYWDSETESEASLTADDPALVQMQGMVISTTLRYPGFNNKALITKIASRDLRSLSTPLLNATIYADDEAENLNIGDVFYFEWPDYHDEPVIMRVTGLGLGDGKSNQIRITCVEDVFAFPEYSIISPSDSEWEDPIAEPTAPANRLLIEAPYYELVQQMGQGNIDSELANTPEIGYLVSAAERPESAINARLVVDDGSGYSGSGTPMDFCPIAFLELDITQIQTVIPVINTQSLGNVSIGSHAQLGDELVRIDGVTDNELTIGRGILDTLPALHDAGMPIFFWDNYAGSNETAYVDGEEVGAKILTVTPKNTLSLADAVEDLLTFDSRAYRPYPPGNFKINNVAFGDTIETDSGLTVSWAHRDRIQQTAGNIIDHLYGNIGPETDVTYSLKLYGENDDLIRSVEDYTDDEYVYSIETEKADSLLESGVAIDGDQYFSNVVILLHFNGTDGSTSFTDQIGTNSWTVNGNAQLDTSWFKFGTASLLCDGTTDYIQSSNPPNLDAATYTIEFWVRFASGTRNGTNQCVICKWDGSSFSNQSYLVHFGAATTSAAPNSLIMEWRQGTGSTTIHSVNFTFAFDTNYFIEVNRSSNTVRFFVNGVLIGTSTATNTHNQVSAITYIGELRWNTTNYHELKGWLDDLRVTNGIARHTAGYQLPTSQFPDILGSEVPIDEYWSNVLTLLRFDGVDASTAITDEITSGGRTWTCYGHAQLDTAWSKWGSSSALFDGNGDDYIMSTQQMVISRVAWTFQFWIKFTSGTRPYSTQMAICQWMGLGTATDDSYLLGFTAASTSAAPNGMYMCWREGSATEVTYSSPAFAFAFDQAYYIEINRSNNIIRFFVDGVLLGTVACTNNHNQGYGYTRIGIFKLNQTFYYPLKGWIDDLRISNGIARNEATYYPPTARHPGVAGTAYRQNGRLRLTLESVRNDLPSMQSYNHEVRRPGYGFNYGYLYGGL